MQRRTLLRAAGAALAIPSLGVAAADKFATRPVTLVVPYAAGGNADLTARLFADALSKSIGQAVVVDNRAGGGGAIGANHVLGSKPDGLTLLFSAPSVFSVTPHLVKVNYRIADMRPVCLVSATPMVLVARKGSQYKSLADLVEAAKVESGKVALGYSGLGTPNHLALLNLETVAKVRFTGVAYKGSGPMLQDLLGGQIEVAPDQISTSRPYIDSGALIPIGVFGEKLDSLPGVPSVSTLGKEPFDVTTYLGLSAPKGTPDELVAEIQKAAIPALKDERFIAGITKMNSSVHSGDAKEFAKLMGAEDAFMSEAVASGRVKTDS